MSDDSSTRQPGSLQPRAGAAHRLPPDRTFVVQLGSEAEPGRGRYTGRVEHVVTGRSTPFRSLVQLLAFFGRVLGTDG